MDTFSQVAAWVALATSGGALWYSKKADRRAADTERREVEQHRRREVFFVAEFVREGHEEYEFRITNTGTETAQYPRVDPESVERYAIRDGRWVTAEPNESFAFRYEKPRYGHIETLKIIWKGPGVGQQHVRLPPHVNTD